MAILTVFGVDDNVTMQAAAAGGDQMPNTGREMLCLYNGSGAARTITCYATDDDGCPAEQLHNHVVVLQDAEYGFIVPANLKPKRFNNASGRVVIGYSSATGVTVAAKRVLE